MRIELKKLMESLGVKGTISAYQTHPWLYYNDEKAITASAEIRAGTGLNNIEAEIQFLYDNPEEHNKTNPDQIMYMRILPKGDLWSPEYLRIRGEDWTNKLGGWEEKACNFFRACVQSMLMNELPDIDELIKKELADDEDDRRGKGKIGRKSPKANPAALLGMKKGM
jgi:hypothetical protein